jgi:hypothetical protein
MTTKDDLHHLVDELDEDAAREALARLNDLRLPRETSLSTRELDALAKWLADRGYRIIGPGLDNQAEVHHTNIRGILRLYG